MSVKKSEKNRVESEKVEEDEGSDSESKPVVKASAKKRNDVKSSSKKKDDGKKCGSGKNVSEKDQDELESSPKSATKSGNLKETPGTSSKRKRNTGKEKVIIYDKSLVGLKVKVWWPEDKTYYEGVIESFDSAKKKHKVSYVDGDEEILNLKTQKWEILEEFTAKDEEQTSEAENEEDASPETHKKKKSKTDPTPSASQDKVKDSAKSAKSKGGSSKDNKSTSQKTPKSTDKSKEDEETPKSKTVNKSKGKSNSNGPGKAKSE